MRCETMVSGTSVVRRRVKVARDPEHEDNRRADEEEGEEGGEGEDHEAVSPSPDAITPNGWCHRSTTRATSSRAK